MARSNEPGIVAKPGRTAMRVSFAGFALSSSAGQNEILSATTAAKVKPRVMRELLVCTSTTTLFFNKIDS